MSVIYNRNNSIGFDNNDLEFRLRRSITMAKEHKMTKKTKAAATKSETRASVSRERKLALVLRALLDATAEIGGSEELEREATNEAIEVLTDLGYATLIGIPRQVAAINEHLKVAVEAGNGALIAQLGRDLERAKVGKAAKETVKPAAKAAAGDVGD